ncbi:MAG TPA: hypothetical protein VF433_01605 [Cellvibrio sp.]
MLKKTNRLLVTCTALTLLASLLPACYSGNNSGSSALGNSEAPQVQPPAATNVQAHVSSVQKITMKPGASVSLANTQPIVLPTIGMHQIELVLQSARHEGEMTISVASSDGMSVDSATNTFHFPLVEQGAYRLPITLYVAREGRHYVRLNVSTTSGGTNEKRVISAIVQAGKPAPAAQKTAPTSTTDGVITLPAQERISPQH